MRFCLLLITLFISCKAGKVELTHVPTFEFINSQCEPRSIPTPTQLEANFRALYYGPKMEHLVVDLSKSFTQGQMYDHFTEVMGISDANIVFLIGKHPLKPSKDYASILIDTTQIFETDFLINESKTGINKRLVCVSHYPIIIENNHISFFEIGYGDELGLTFEALDASGKWKPISHNPIRFCGTGLRSVPLAAKEIAISALPITAGELKTKGRIRFDEVLSNEISIRIDSTAFKSPF